MTMKATDSVEAADVVDTDMQFLYADGEYWHFMQPESFEQVQADKAGVGDAAKWLKGEEDCVVTLWNGTPIAVTPPNFVELKIVETDPGVRGDTSGGGGKPATLETGAVVRVPLFVGQDEIDQGRHPYRRVRLAGEVNASATSAAQTPPAPTEAGAATSLLSKPATSCRSTRTAWCSKTTRSPCATAPSSRCCRSPRPARASSRPKRYRVRMRR